MILFDTNIFLEVLLEQEKSDKCKNLIIENKYRIFISDFSLHSIGVILFRYRKEKVFNEFMIDLIEKITIVSLQKNSYKELSQIKEKFNLDFDDAYQFMVAKENNLKIFTLDNDFKKVSNEIEVISI